MTTTRRTFPTIDGVRYAIPGDRARHLAGGGFEFLGRESMTINTGGEKVFAEEVEWAIKELADVEDAQVIGLVDPDWGQKVVALVSSATGISVDAVRAHCREKLAAYKVPREVILLDHITKAPNGKPDYQWAKDTAHTALNA